jgi:4'-phosphopantetheinyl transferase
MRHGPVTLESARRIECCLLSDGCGPSLTNDAVHVWVLNDSDVGQASAAFAQTLSPGELKRAQACIRARDRDRVIARRGVLRRLLGHYLNCRPECLVFGVTGFGKPFVQREGAAQLAFNVSQGDGTALLAFAWDCRIGVDVERPIGGFDVAGVARQTFSSMELKTLEAARSDSTDTFFSIWVRKEALLKALGTGLYSGELKSLTTEDESQLASGRWRALYNGTVVTSRWTCVDIDLGPHARGALAASLEGVDVSLYVCSFLP